MSVGHRTMLFASRCLVRFAYESEGDFDLDRCMWFV